MFRCQRAQLANGPSGTTMSSSLLQKGPQKRCCSRSHPDFLPAQAFLSLLRCWVGTCVCVLGQGHCLPAAPSLDAVVFCPGDPPSSPTAFLKEGKHGRDTAACVATAPHWCACPGLCPCWEPFPAGSSARHAWGPLHTTHTVPTLSSPSHLHQRTEMPSSLEGSSTPLSWLKTHKCWMQEGLKKAWIKPDSDAMPLSGWGKAQPAQRGTHGQVRNMK